MSISTTCDGGRPGKRFESRGERSLVVDVLVLGDADLSLSETGRRWKLLMGGGRLGDRRRVERGRGVEMWGVYICVILFRVGSQDGGRWTGCEVNVRGQCMPHSWIESRHVLPVRCQITCRYVTEFYNIVCASWKFRLESGWQGRQPENLLHVRAKSGRQTLPPPLCSHSPSWHCDMSLNLPALRPINFLSSCMFLICQNPSAHPRSNSLPRRICIPRSARQRCPL